ncbi:hypothetical protein THRCLA_20920 [Thraustotheca clavata]|uniref:Uncharacterized protein n=1 Tax=Thraustotheca clavata TaxID=74557 RepID=A0A1W0A1X6_9STRA|nr:hypothetical protein THRCLA_20920 [Thraustotheca clavata]
MLVLTAGEGVGLVLASLALAVAVAMARYRHQSPVRRGSVWSSAEDEDVQLLQDELTMVKAKRKPFFYPVLEESVVWWEEWQRKAQQQGKITPLTPSHPLTTTTLVTA